MHYASRRHSPGNLEFIADGNPFPAHIPKSDDVSRLFAIRDPLQDIIREQRLTRSVSCLQARAPVTAKASLPNGLRPPRNRICQKLRLLSAQSKIFIASQIENHAPSGSHAHVNVSRNAEASRLAQHGFSLYFDRRQGDLTPTQKGCAALAAHPLLPPSSGRKRPFEASDMVDGSRTDLFGFLRHLAQLDWFARGHLYLLVNYTMKSRPANRGSEFTLLVHHPA